MISRSINIFPIFEKSEIYVTGNIIIIRLFLTPKDTLLYPPNPLFNLKPPQPGCQCNYAVDRSEPKATNSTQRQGSVKGQTAGNILKFLCTLLGAWGLLTLYLMKLCPSI